MSDPFDSSDVESPRVFSRNHKKKGKYKVIDDIAGEENELGLELDDEHLNRRDQVDSDDEREAFNANENGNVPDLIAEDDGHLTESDVDSDNEHHAKAKIQEMDNEESEEDTETHLNHLQETKKRNSKKRSMKDEIDMERISSPKKRYVQTSISAVRQIEEQYKKCISPVKPAASKKSKAKSKPKKKAKQETVDSGVKRGEPGWEFTLRNKQKWRVTKQAEWAPLTKQGDDYDWDKVDGHKHYFTCLQLEVESVEPIYDIFVMHGDEKKKTPRPSTIACQVGKRIFKKIALEDRIATREKALRKKNIAHVKGSVICFVPQTVYANWLLEEERKGKGKTIVVEPEEEEEKVVVVEENVEQNGHVEDPVEPEPDLSLFQTDLSTRLHLLAQNWMKVNGNHMKEKMFEFCEELRSKSHMDELTWLNSFRDGLGPMFLMSYVATNHQLKEQLLKL